MAATQIPVTCSQVRRSQDWASPDCMARKTRTGSHVNTAHNTVKKLATVCKDAVESLELELCTAFSMTDNVDFNKAL